jgi:hypothetical protein
MISRRLLIASAAACLVVATCAGISISTFVSGNGAYAFYMPPSHGIRTLTCDVRIWGIPGHSYHVSGDWLQCSIAAAYFAGAAERDPSVPLQWDPAHVQLHSRAPVR